MARKEPICLSGEAGQNFANRSIPFHTLGKAFTLQNASHVRIRVAPNFMAHDVFISYSAKDKLTADAVCAKLESRGVRCWIAPRDILASEEYAAALVNALRGSRLMVLVFSSGANQSQQVLREVERAVSKGLPILPLRIEDVPPSEAMEFYISSRHWLDALTPPLEQHLAQLSDTVTLLLSRPADAAHHPEFQPQADAVPMAPFPPREIISAAPVSAPPVQSVRPVAELFSAAPAAAVAAPTVAPSVAYIPPVVSAPVPPTSAQPQVTSVPVAVGQKKKPMLAFVLNFLVAGLGFVYLGKLKWAALNLVGAMIVGVFTVSLAPDSLGVVGAVIAAIDGGIAKAVADKMNAQLTS
jgi:TIR domain